MDEITDTANNINEEFNAKVSTLLSDACTVTYFYKDVVRTRNVELVAINKIITAAANFAQAETDMCLNAEDLHHEDIPIVLDLIRTRCQHIDNRVIELTDRRKQCLAEMAEAQIRVNEAETIVAECHIKLSNKRAKIEHVILQECKKMRPVLHRECKKINLTN